MRTKTTDASDLEPVREKLTELEALVQDGEGKPIDDEVMDEAAIQAKVKEVEESMHAISSKLYEAAAAEMAEAENNEGDGSINVEGDDVVDADFEVVDEEDLKHRTYVQATVGSTMSDVRILEDMTVQRDVMLFERTYKFAVALAGAVRSTLGLKGLDKLLVDDEGRSMVTNDGITVLESAKVEHPIAHMLIAASATQDQTVRDGTTTTVLLASEWLQNAWHLVVQGVHPATIARGFRMAESYCKDHIESLKFEATKEHVYAAAMTSLAGKLHTKMQSTISECAVEAAEAITMTSNGNIVADPTQQRSLALWPFP